jgi:SanA protein
VRRWLRRALIVLVIFAAAVAGGNLYVLSTTSPAIFPSADVAPARPYVIVLGNRVFPGDIPAPELANRLNVGLALYRGKRAARIIVSGRVGSVSYDEPRAMRAWLIAQGVPVADVITDPGGYRTAATMAGAAALGVRAALIATQDYHLPRALYLARHAGIDAVGVPAPRSAVKMYDKARVWLREAFARVEIILEVAFRGVKA